MLRNLRNSLLSASLLSLLAPLAACSAGDAASEEVDEDNGALLGGTESTAEDDAVFALYRRGEPWCAATLIAPNVLLTALHCVADLDTSGPQPMVGARLMPQELSVHFGNKPSANRAAIVSRIVVPDAVEKAQGPVPLRSIDIAALYVQPIDASFAQVKPRTVSQKPSQGDSTVRVVGYTTVARDPFGFFTQLRRERRDGVYVWAGAQERSLVQAVLEDGRSFYWRNRAAELTTEVVACGSDSGGPAFDLAGNLVGIVAGVVGECAQGSLSVFTDVASQAPFLQKLLGGTSQLCLTDAQCGAAASGRVCDAKTNRCMLGCRVGSNQCGAGTTCSVQGQPVGTLGICRGPNGAGPSDPLYNQGPYTAPEAAKCPGDPLCPQTPGTRECQVDAECKGQVGAKPRVCDIPRGRCLDGCRVAAQGMCSAGQACGASADDPNIGLCQAAQTPPPVANTPPASPPTIQSEPPAAGEHPDAIVGPGGESGDAGPKKKKKSKAAGDDGGCSVSQSGAPAPVGFAVALGLALALASRRRARR